MKSANLIIIFLFILNFQGISQDIDDCVAVQRVNKISVDGDLSDWNVSYPLILDSEEQVTSFGLWNGVVDFSAKAYVMWDTKNLYIAAEVIDNMPFRFLNAPGIDGVDCLVLYINTNNEENCERDLYSSNDFRVLFALDNNRFPTAIDRNPVLLKKGFQTVGMNKDRNVLEGYEVGINETSNGYNLELKIPLNALANEKLSVLQPLIGMRICFNLQFIDLDEATDDEIDSVGNRVSLMTLFPGQPQIKPRDWGYLIFK